MATKKPKKEKVIEPFWNEIVSAWFSFCEEKFGEKPSFDGSAPRDLKSIIKTLHERAISSNVEWNLESALSRFNNFLIFSYQDNWLKNNFLLFNLNRQKDKIFFNIRAAKNRQIVHPFE